MANPQEPSTRISVVQAPLRFLRHSTETVRTIHDYAMFVVTVASLAVSLVVGWKFGVAWGVATFLGVIASVFFATGVRLVRKLEEAETQTPSLIGGQGGASPGGNAGGGGAVASGPNAYAEGGKGGGGVSLLEVLARAALTSPLPLAEFIRNAGFDPEGNAINRTFGGGGDGGDSGAAGSEDGSIGEGGLVVVTPLDADGNAGRPEIFGAEKDFPPKDST
jgi:hypothetical protein